VAVSYPTIDGKARAGQNCPGTGLGDDYRGPASGVLSFHPGSTVESITLMVCGNDVKEDNEAFAIQLSCPVSATLLKNLAQHALLNEDNPGAVTRTQPIWQGWFAGDALERARAPPSAATLPKGADASSRRTGKKTGSSGPSPARLREALV